MNQQVATASRAVPNSGKILSALALSGSMHLNQLADMAQVPRASVYRIVDSLDAIDFVTVLSDGRVALSTRLLGLGNRAQLAVPEVRAAGESLESIRAASGHTSYFCARRDGNIVCMDWRQGFRVGLPVLRPGSALPPHAGAATLAILAFENGQGADRVPVSLLAVTPKTIIDPEELAVVLREVNRQGFSVSDEDVTLGVAAIGVPVFDARGTLRGALSVSGLRESLIPSVPELAELLVRESKKVGVKLANS